MTLLVVLAGVGQLLLALASLTLPRVLGWRAEAAKLRPLTRQVFWTYAAYIWGTNLAFGLISTLAPERLLDTTPLARWICGYITLYWGARLGVQIFYFDRSAAPSGAFYRAAEALLLGLFVFLTGIYGYAALA